MWLFRVNLYIYGLTCVFFAKPLLFPRLNIPTIATPTVCFFYYYLMPLMIWVLETIHTLNATVVSGAVVALGDYLIKINMYLFIHARLVSHILICAIRLVAWTKRVTWICFWKVFYSSWNSREPLVIVVWLFLYLFHQ